MTLRGDRNLADGHEATTEMSREEQMGVGWEVTQVLIGQERVKRMVMTIKRRHIKQTQSLDLMMMMKLG
jgi:hypothetical protein